MSDAEPISDDGPTADVDPELAVDAVEPRRRLAPFVVLGVAVVLVALLVFLAAGDASRDESADSALLGKVAPATRGDLVGGGSFDLSRRKGSWVVMNFFDPACGPCVAEHPELVVLAQQQAGIADGAELYTIISRQISPRGDDVSDIVQFFEDNGGDWPIVEDPTGAISVAYGVSQVPETWIVDPNGVVRRRLVGQITADGVSAELQALREGAA